jgi:signal transduction histidine kinase
VFGITYFVLRRTLRPLRALNAGVARLAEGQLDVEVPNPGKDEFGALTGAFNRMARRVRDMLGARDQLLRDVSHELRSPLTRLKVALALLPEHPSKAAMSADVDEMERMVAELLELERLREGRGVRRERQDLTPLLHEVAAEFEGRLPGVRLGPRSRSLPVEIDRDQIRTVLRNLLENAFKYALPDSRPVTIAAVDEPGRVVVRIQDDGPGIPAAERGRLFEPFFRVDPSRSKQTGGYGLGLSICKRIMEAHGGSIAVEATGARGATFVLAFPVGPSRGPSPE